MKTIMILLLSICFACTAQAQAPKVNGTPIKDTTIKEVKYKLYIGPKGGRFYMKPNADGKLKKVYIPKN